MVIPPFSPFFHHLHGSIKFQIVVHRVLETLFQGNDVFPVIRDQILCILNFPVEKTIFLRIFDAAHKASVLQLLRTEPISGENRLYEGSLRGHISSSVIGMLVCRLSFNQLIGSGDINLELWRVFSTRLGLKGSGDINVNFREGCQAVDCELRGSGDIELSGVVSRFSQQKSGSGDVHVDKLRMLK